MILLLLPFGLSVSAAIDDSGNEIILVDGLNDIYCNNNSEYGFSVDGIMYYVKRGDTIYDGGRVDSIYLSGGVYRLRLDLNSVAGKALNQGDVVYVTIMLTPLHSSFFDENNTVTGSFRFGMKNDATVMSSYDIRRYDGSKYQSAKRDVQYTDFHDFVKCSFNENTFGNVYDMYTIDFQYKVSGYEESYSQYIYLQNFNFKVVDKDKYYADQIGNSIDQGMDKVVENQNENADKITQNQNDNTDKILNSGEYDDIDQSALEDYSQSSEELDNSLSDGYSKVEDVFNGGFASDLLGQDGSIPAGLRAVRVIFEDFSSIGSISQIIKFALFLGCISFVLGTVINIYKRGH